MNPPSEDKKARARKWVNGYTVVGTGVVIAAVIPGTTSTALAVMEAHMCYQIGKIYRGEKYTMQEAVAMAKIIGLVAITAPLIALEALNTVPIAGWAVKGTIAGGVIKTLGEAIIARYEKMEKESTGNDEDDIKFITEAHRSPTDAPEVLTRPPAIPHGRPIHGAAPTTEKRLKKLDELYAKKLISAEEYNHKRKQILSEL